MSLREEIIEQMRRSYKRMTAPEQAVTRLLVAATKPITQAKIAKTEMFLGTHPQHEHVSIETSTRRVRQIVHDLKVKHGIIIIAGTEGYKIPNTKDECFAYLLAEKRKRDAMSKSLQVTYNVMRAGIGRDEPIFSELDI